MEKNWREFRSIGKKATLVWKCAVENEIYYVESGQLNGKQQKFSTSPGPKGKEGSKSYVNAADNAKFHVNREIRYKKEEGYVEWIDGKPVSENITSIDFNEFLPTCLSPYKPISSIEDKELVKLYKTGNLLFSIKRDGFAFIAAHHPWGWEIYSRRLELQTDKFFNHINELNKVKEFGVGTILIGELQCVYDGKEKFKDIQRFAGSDLDVARKLVDDKEISEPIYMIFDALFIDGKDLKDLSYEDRSKLWRNPVEKEQLKLITLVEYVNVTPESWEDYAKQNKLEGFVVVDKKSKFGNKLYNFNGKPSRPNGSYKLKLWFTGDVVIFAGTKGSGKRTGGLGAVHLKQIDPKTGKYFYVSKCGTGFDDEMLKELGDLFKKYELPIFEKDKDAEKIELYQEHIGIVAEVKYPERMPKTNSLRFPVFVRLRMDKKQEECIAEHLVTDSE